MEENFVLPDEYKEVQAVQGCHSVADLCKKIVDNESFIGKLKSERAMPTATDGDDAWNAFFGKTKAVAEQQDWADIDANFANIAKNAGIVKQQAKPILDYINAEKDKGFDPEQFKQMKADAFKGKESTLNKIDAMMAKMSDKSVEDLLDINNDGLIKVYGFLGELAEQMAVKESATPPTTTGTPDTTKVFDSDGKLNAEQLSKMQDEILALPNTPNKQELKDAIFKKYGFK